MLGLLLFFKHKQDSCYFDKSKRYLVVRNYNTEGGFFWCIHNILRASHYAHLLNMQLVVWFDEGFYLETNHDNIRKYNLQDRYQPRG